MVNGNDGCNLQTNLANSRLSGMGNTGRKNSHSQHTGPFDFPIHLIVGGNGFRWGNGCNNRDVLDGLVD